MAKVEVLIPLSLYCDVGRTDATVMVSSRDELTDNVDSFVEKPCAGCSRWTERKVEIVEDQIREEMLELFGTDSNRHTGISHGRINRLEQLLVDNARFKGGSHKLVVALCTPVSKNRF